MWVGSLSLSLWPVPQVPGPGRPGSTAVMATHNQPHHPRVLSSLIGPVGGPQPFLSPLSSCPWPVLAYCLPPGLPRACPWPVLPSCLPPLACPALLPPPWPTLACPGLLPPQGLPLACPASPWPVLPCPPASPGPAWPVLPSCLPLACPASPGLPLACPASPWPPPGLSSPIHKHHPYFSASSLPKETITSRYIFLDFVVVLKLRLLNHFFFCSCYERPEEQRFVGVTLSIYVCRQFYDHISLQAVDRHLTYFRISSPGYGSSAGEILRLILFI